MFKVVALDMVAAPNTFAYAENNLWKVQQDGDAVLWGMLYVVDSLSERRYITDPSAILTITFFRSDLPGTDTSRSVIKVATVNVQDASLFSISLSAQEVKTIMSGTVNFKLVEGTSTTSWNQNWAVKKTPVRTGC
jgi:hypothetical protein